MVRQTYGGREQSRRRKGFRFEEQGYSVREAVLLDLAERLVNRIAKRSIEEMRSLRLVDWGRTLLSAHFRLEPSKMHVWLSEELDRMTHTRGTKLNVLGPRGSAKSTLGTLAYVLRAAVEESEPYIWIVSDTIKQARRHLAHVKTELEQNELIEAHYRQACKRGRDWRADSIELRSGVVIEAYSTGQRLRGLRRGRHRPSLIVCDDLQNDSHINSAAQRQASRDWFHSALMKAGDGRTNIVNFATALHRDALAMELHRTSGWRSKLFQAIETWPERMDLWADWEEFYVNVEAFGAQTMAEDFFQENREAMLAGSELLWPQHEDLYTLMRMRVDSGKTAFEREKQNSPVDPSKCEWPEEYFGHHIWFDEWPRKLEVRVAALDPSKGTGSGVGDYSAYVLLGIDDHGVLYVEADMARRPTTEMVETGVLLFNRFGPDAIGIEANQFQYLLEGEFKQAFARMHAKQRPINAINNYVSKMVRIRRLGPYLSQRRMRFFRKSKGTKLLVDQLRDFPLGAHDDGPDALEMAVRMAEALEAPRVDDGLGDRLIGGE